MTLLRLFRDIDYENSLRFQFSFRVFDKNVLHPCQLAVTNNFYPVFVVHDSSLFSYVIHDDDSFIILLFDSFPRLSRAISLLLANHITVALSSVLNFPGPLDTKVCKLKQLLPKRVSPSVSLLVSCQVYLSLMRPSFHLFQSFFIYKKRNIYGNQYM